MDLAKEGARDEFRPFMFSSHDSFPGANERKYPSRKSTTREPSEQGNTCRGREGKKERKDRKNGGGVEGEGLGRRNC